MSFHSDDSHSPNVDKDLGETVASDWERAQASKKPKANKIQITCNDDQQEQQQRRRELNRLSKLKCRKRKRDLIKSLQAKVDQLKKVYNSLRAENAQLRQEFLACCNAVWHDQTAIDQNSSRNSSGSDNEQLLHQEFMRRYNAQSLAPSNHTSVVMASLPQVLLHQYMIAAAASAPPRHHVPFNMVLPPFGEQQNFPVAEPSYITRNGPYDISEGIESSFDSGSN